MSFGIRIVTKAALILFIILLTMFAAETIRSQTTGEIGEDIDVGVKLTDMSFFSGDGVDVTVDSTDDVFAVGSTISVDATSADHLVVAGSKISVKNVAIQDLFAAAGELDLISGRVEDDIVVAVGQVNVGPSFEIGGSAVIAGGEARIETPIPADLRVGAESIFLNSAVGGDARLSGDTVTLGPQARISGNLLYRSENLILQDGAVVSGQQMMLPPEEHSAFESWGRGAGGLLAKITIAATLGFMVLVIVVAIAVPGLMRSSAGYIRSKPFKSLGIGALFTIGVPFLIILLVMSVVGAPLAMLLGAICLAITPIAVAATAYLLGMEGRQLLTKQTEPPVNWAPRLLWPALGAAVILVLGLIPFFGLLVWLLAMLFGLGAVVSRGRRALAVNA